MRQRKRVERCIGRGQFSAPQNAAGLESGTWRVLEDADPQSPQPHVLNSSVSTLVNVQYLLLCMSSQSSEACYSFQLALRALASPLTPLHSSYFLRCLRESANLYLHFDTSQNKINRVVSHINKLLISLHGDTHLQRSTLSLALPSSQNPWQPSETKGRALE